MLTTVVAVGSSPVWTEIGVIVALLDAESRELKVGSSKYPPRWVDCTVPVRASDDNVPVAVSSELDLEMDIQLTAGAECAVPVTASEDAVKVSLE